jgi:hypothetical protein
VNTLNYTNQKKTNTFKMSSQTPLGPQPPYPIHPSIKGKLDPIYADFYNKHIFDKQQVHLQPVAASRTSGVLLPGAGPQLPVGKIEDFQIRRTQTEGPDVPIRVFTPEGEKPEDGWPVMIYYHGGGWVLGNIDTENVVCSNLCARANCVVITVDYRYFPSKSRLSARAKTDYKDLHQKTSIQQPSTIPGNLSSG